MGAAALAARIHSPTALSLANTIQGTAAGRAIAGGARSPPAAMPDVDARGVAWDGALLLAVAVLKAAAILLDPQIRLFLGDSASYLFAARSDEWLPGDRSFTYPLLLESLVRPTGSLQALLYWQALAGIGIALLLARVLRVHFRLPALPVLLATCAFALEPAQLFYERMVLAETFGLLAFVAFYAAACAYLVHARVAWLAVVAVLGIGAVSLRMNYLPVVTVITLALPLVMLLDPARRPRAWRLLAHCMVAALCFWGTHGQYKQYVGELFDTKPAYIARAGFMRMGLVAPLIKPEHFLRVGLPADFADRLAYDLADPHTRPSQLWNHGGLADAIAEAGLDVNRTCRKLSIYALRDDPFGVVRLALVTLAGYFNPDSSARRLAKDLGRDPLPYPARVVSSVKNYWHYDMSGVAERWTPVSRAFAAASSWLVACLFLLLPLSLANVLVHWRDPRRLQAVLAALFGIGLVSSEVLFSNIASYRYLHAFPFFVLVNALPLAATLWHRRRQRRHAAQGLVPR
jgi:hypothetical protein